MMTNKKSKTCPLCNGKTFSKGDDFKELCAEHSTRVVSLLICAVGSEISGSAEIGIGRKKCGR